MTSPRPLLYFHTLRHLRPAQWLYLPARRLARTLRLSRPRPTRYRLANARLGALTRHVQTQPGSAAVDAGQVAAVLDHRYRFLEEELRLDVIDWARPYGTPLWAFHLHYFSYAELLARAHASCDDARALGRMVELVDAWIAQDKPVDGTAWAAYTVAQRLVHWSRAFLLTRDALAPAFAARWLGSIASQVRYLAGNIEWQLQGNHVLKNLYGLLCGAALFDDPRATRLAAGAARRLWREVGAQVLPDGLHYERSAMYHADALADLHDAAAIVAILGLPLPPLRDTLAGMVEALARMARPDGSLHLFNDAANQDAAGVRRLIATASGVPGAWALPAGGYYGFVSDRVRFIIDCGEPGPRHQPGHAHCDALSYELDLDGVPVVVDSGTSGYDHDPLRAYLRSTRAHNTVQVGDLEQHEMWGTFRVARRGRICGARITGAPGFGFEGAASPFAAPRTVHERRAHVDGAAVRIEDRVRGSADGVVRSYVHLHPSVDVRLDDGRAVLRLASGRGAVLETRGMSDARVVIGRRDPDQGWYAPRFGVRQPAPVIELTAKDPAEPFGYVIRKAD